MELIQSQIRPNPLEPSSPIHWIVPTGRFLRMLEVSVNALRRRQKEVQLELKEPGIGGNKKRLRELLAELERIARALRGQSAPGAAL
ncbi:MAG TPA: hypothetical protein VIH75_12480 [Candidatus Sulfotelmatobacter sp.]|jgi:hypothetical protein